MKVFLQDKEGFNHELDFNQFYNTLPDDIEKKKYLEEFFYDIYNHMKDNKKADEILTTSVESNIELPLGQPFKVLSKFFEYNTDKLAQFLCQNKLNPKYIKANANAAIVTHIFLNTIRSGRNAEHSKLGSESPGEDVIIKGFAFCTNPVKDELYVTTTCGTGGTAKLFGSMLENVQDKGFERDYKYIKLDSVENPDTIRFYTKLGFRKPDKDTINIIKDMYNSEAKTFEQYIDKTKKIVGGPMYLFPINAEGEKMLKKKKCNYIYSPEEWFNELKKFKKEGKSVEEFLEINKKDKLEGAGIGDWFRSGVGKVKEFFRPVINKYSNKSTDTINKFGNYVIKELEIMRTPINKVFDKIFNLITFNKWDEIKKKYGYDRLFHLALVATIRVGGIDKKIIMEKNEVVNISTDYKVYDNTEIQKVPLQGKDIRIGELLEEARKKVGDNVYFDYDAFTNNCQFFIKYLLESSGLLSKEANAFLFQDMKDVIKDLPSYVSPVANSVTTLGALVSKLRGDGKDNYELHAVIFRKPYDINSAKSKAKEFIKGNKDFFRETQTSYRFRNIPKTKFKPKSFRSKRIDPNITLVFGALK